MHTISSELRAADSPTSVKPRLAEPPSTTSRINVAGWSTVPTLLITLTGIQLLWLNGWQVSHFSYWRIQEEWFWILNHFLQYPPPSVWLNLTHLGDATVLFALMSPLLLWRPRAWAAMLGAIPLAATFSLVGKYLFAMPRPGAVLDHDSFVSIGGILKAHNSLPSGHSITVVACMVAVLATLVPIPCRGREWAIISFCMALTATICLSRVAVGAHWPLDITFGAALGWIAGLSGVAVTLRYQAWWRSGQHPYGQVILAITLLVLGLVLAPRSVETFRETPVLSLAAATSIATMLLLLWGNRKHTASIVRQFVR